MTTLNWIHLSDWHQTGKDFKRVKLRDALVKDIETRAKISSDLATIDFIVFSGDVAFFGKPEEYQAAATEFFDPVLKAARVTHDRLFIVPGNHDLSRNHIYDMLPAELQKPFDTAALVEKWLTDDERRARTLEPFKAYRDFVAGYTGQGSPDYASVIPLSAGGKQIALLGLNSAWMCARYKEKDGKDEVNDYGRLVLGDPQLYCALEKAKGAQVLIAVLHHPFDWLTTTDTLPEKSQIREQLSKGCHFILHGHEHEPNVTVPRGTVGDCAIISAGSSYERTDPAASRYAHGYNFVHLDFAAGKGAVYLRRYDERQRWIRDTGATGDETPGYSEFTLPKDLGPKPASSSLSPLVTPSPAPVQPPPPPHFEHERTVLEGYLNALVRNNTDLEPGGIKQTKVQVILPLDEIYVGLQADRDRPDVDRRVMQEELDEIKKRLEREEDPKEREKQYQIWANQARTLQQALEISGPREDLSSIVQRHRQVVILGEPGSGKTTLVRYLTLRFARAILAEPERIFQPQELWDEKTVWRLPDLGPVRLPILLRISHYAEARQKDPDLSLVDYLPRYFEGLQVPHADELGPLLQRLLEEGRCMVLLDGLDEIIDPTDRRNIATAIGQFAGVYRETGLPDWLARLLAFVPARAEEKPEAHAESEDEEAEIIIPWDKNVPEDVRQEWGKQIKQRQKGWRRRGRAVRLAWELLGEARYAHVGNRFVVTSRIAGYHFAGVPGEFEHYAIRRMSLDDIKLFLEKWCPAVERRIAEAPDPLQVEQRARREIEGILQAVETTPGVRRMAENPLLLRILAIIHRNEAHLPQRRVELYETATVTLLRDWHLERGTPKEAVIDDVKAMSLLGPVAFYIHENRASGFLSKGETERILGGILARERGEKDPEQPSLETREAVHHFLETVREHSGLFVERGEGLYGFMHLTFEEYFTARQLVSSATRARPQILERLHLPRWREPILLAVGSLSKQFYDDTHDLLRAILEAGSAYEGMLHRDLLFAAACVGDSVNVAPVLRQEIAGRLLALYCDRRRAGRYRLLQQQVKDALLALCNDQGDAAVEAALANMLACCADRAALTCALDAVDWLKARTPAVARALAACPDLGTLPRAQDLLHKVQTRLPVNSNGTRPAPAGWDAVRDDPALARLLGAVRRYGWRDSLPPSLGIRKDALDNADRELHSLSLYRAVGLANSLLQRFNDTPMDRRDAEFWNAVAETLQDIWRAAPGGSKMETAARRLMQAVASSLENREDTRGTAENLNRFLDRRRLSRQSEAAAPGTLALDQALAQFQDVVREQEGAVTDLDFEQVLQSAGSHLLKGASAGHTLAITFAAAAGHFGSLRPLPDDDTLRANVQTLQSEIGHTLLARLRSTANGQQYQEAALFLAFPSTDPFRSRSDSESEEARLSAEAAGIVCTDLDGADAMRRRWALQALTSRSVRERVQFTDARRALLLGLLDAPTDQATPALDILFALDLTSDFLSWCWSVLRRPDHPLADAVREQLDGVKKVKGDRPTLALLDEGLRDGALRPSALELVRQVKWQGTETFAQALAWLSDVDTEVRHLAALLLAGQDDLPAIPRSVLARAAQERLPATGASWAALREDARLVRLLGGLWLQGWDDALTQLWVAQPAVPYVDRHPSKYWRNFRTYPESEECIRWLLEEAAFGQTLISTFQEAAARLAELEGEAQGAPQAEHIAAIQQEMTRQIDELLAQPATPPLLRAETDLLAAAVRKEAIPPILTETVQAALSSADESERWTALSRLASHAELVPWLRTQCAPASDHPLAAWLRHALAAHDLAPDAPPAALARLLTTDDPDARAAASLALLATDLPALLVAALVETAQSPDDRVRIQGKKRLYSVCGSLPTDGSTGAVQEIIDFYWHIDPKEAGGYLQTIAYNAALKIKHEHPFGIKQWLEMIAQDENSTAQQARKALYTATKLSPPVVSLLCDVLNNQANSVAVRRSVSFAISEILRTQPSQRSNEVIRSALTQALTQATDMEVRYCVADGLHWVDGQGAWETAENLLHAAQTDSAVEVRRLALWSLGRVLYTLQGNKEVDVSKEALLEWLAMRVRKERLPEEVVQLIHQLPQLPTWHDIVDSETLLSKLTDPADLGWEPTLAHTPKEAWHELLQAAGLELVNRHYWLERLPNLPKMIRTVETFLTSPNETIRRNAACSLAYIFHDNEDRPAQLRALLVDEAAVMRALLDASGTEMDIKYWDDDRGGSRRAVNQIATLIQNLDYEAQQKLIDAVLQMLEEALEALEIRKKERLRPITFASDYPYNLSSTRSILCAVLAELSERLTYRAFTRTRDLANVVALFVRAATDPYSYYTRHFAIRALGNLQQLSERVADVFFAACQDVEEVYRETRTAVSKFKVFGPGSLERLTAAIRSPSITVAYHAALLLGELGVSRSEDLGREGRKRVADELVQLLDDPLAARIVYDFSKGSDGKRVGPLYDVIYEALVRVVAGPDAPVAATEPAQSG